MKCPFCKIELIKDPMFALEACKNIYCSVLGYEVLYNQDTYPYDEAIYISDYNIHLYYDRDLVGYKIKVESHPGRNVLLDIEGDIDLLGMTAEKLLEKIKLLLLLT